MKTCNSSLLSAYEYHDDSWTLTVVFKSNNSVRAYADVPPELYAEFDKSDSKGKFYNQHLKGKFESLQGGDVTDDEIAEAVQESASPVPMRKLTEEEELGITEADMDAAPGLRRPEPIIGDDLVTPAEKESLSMPEKKQPQVEKKIAEWSALVPASTAPLVVRDRNHYMQIADTLKKKVSIREFVFGLLDPARDAVYKAYQAIQQRQKSVLEPMDQSILADKRALVAFDNEQQRIAREAQMKAQREAEAEAERERVRRTEELRMQVAQQQAEDGHAEEAEQTLFDEEIQAPPVPVYVPRIVADTPEIEGFSGRKNWRAEVTDFSALVLDVAAGINRLKEVGRLEGHAPISVLEAKMPALNKLAKANETSTLFPGVHAFNDPTLSVAKGK